jgi:hypothetical protein
LPHLLSYRYLFSKRADINLINSSSDSNPSITTSPTPPFIAPSVTILSDEAKAAAASQFKQTLMAYVGPRYPLLYVLPVSAYSCAMFEMLLELFDQAIPHSYSEHHFVSHLWYVAY